MDKGNTLYKQTSAELTVGGDVFELPAGPVKVALGVHWRRDSINDTPGEIRWRIIFGAARLPGSPRAVRSRKEAFGELEVPILENAPFARSLTLSAAPLE